MYSVSRLRRPLVFLHRWAGLVMAVFLIVEGITGSLLAFRADLTGIFDPGLVATPPYPGAKLLSAGELAARADAILWPEARVGYFFLTGETGQQIMRVGPRLNPNTGKPYAIDYGILFLDPWTGREMGRMPFDRYTGNLLHDIMPFVYDLHIALAMGGNGAWLLGIVALVWTIDCFVGFYLTLPVKHESLWRRWKPSWLIKWPSSAFRLNFDLHRAGGLWLWALLFVFAWSSVNLTLFSVYEGVTGALFDYETAEQEFGSLPQHAPEVPPRLGWMEAQMRGDEIMSAIAKSDGFQIVAPATFAYFEGNGIYSYEVRTTRRFPHFENLGIYFDGDTGTLVRTLHPDGEHLGNTITNWLRALHMVSDPVGSIYYRVIVFIFGLLLSGIAGTGVYIWWKKRSARLRRKGTRMSIST